VNAPGSDPDVSFTYDNLGRIKMGLTCKNCSKRGIPILEAVAYSTDGSMRCRSCGAVSAVPEPLRTVFGVLEGASVLVGAIYSVALITILPFLVSILIAAIVRVVIAPRFAKVSKETLL